MKDKIACDDCYENSFSKGMKEMYPKKVKCPYCFKVIVHRKPTKKESSDTKEKKQ